MLVPGFIQQFMAILIYLIIAVLHNLAIILVYPLLHVALQRGSYNAVLSLDKLLLKWSSTAALLRPAGNGSTGSNTYLYDNTPLRHPRDGVLDMYYMLTSRRKGV